MYFVNELLDSGVSKAKAAPDLKSHYGQFGQNLLKNCGLDFDFNGISLILFMIFFTSGYKKM